MTRFIKCTLVFLLLVSMMFTVTGCSGQNTVTIWVFYGDMVSEDSVSAYLNDTISSLNGHYEISYYSDDDAQLQIRTAKEAGTLPDIVLCRYGLYADQLSDCSSNTNLSSYVPSTLLPAVAELTRDTSFLPLCLDFTCMAINLEMFEDADALDNIDQDTHSWSTDAFKQSVISLYSYGQNTVAAVYCGDQNGIDGTLALINNLYGGTLCDASGNYILNSEENLQSLSYLTDLKSIILDSDIVGSDEAVLFSREQYAMSFSWGPKSSHLETKDFTVLPMNYPGSSSTFIPGKLYGTAVCTANGTENQDAIDAFLSVLYGDAYPSFTENALCFPVDGQAVYQDDEKMTELSSLVDNVTVFYEAMPGFDSARAQLWQVLRAIGNGSDMEETIAAFIWSMQTQNS